MPHALPLPSPESPAIHLEQQEKASANGMKRSEFDLLVRFFASCPVQG